MEHKKAVITDTLIFLTGCINPGGMAYTALNDPEIRTKQYVQAIKFYIDNTNVKILFVENSNNDISSFFPEEIKSQRIEIITFDGNTYDKKLGKGYGEMGIIDYAFKHSTSIEQADFIFKITGRLSVLNIQSIISQANNGKKTQVLVNLYNFLSNADSRCWGACKAFYIKFLIPNKFKVNDSLNVFFEHILCKAVHLAISEDYSFSFLESLPRYSGIHASTGEKYNHSFFYWLPFMLKHKIRLLVLK